jgi:hypothetical protein
MIPLNPDERGIIDIQPGEDLILRTTWGSTRDNVVHRVVNVTKTGKIRLDNGLLFSPDGIKKEPGWGLMLLCRKEAKE